MADNLALWKHHGGLETNRCRHACVIARGFLPQAGTASLVQPPTQNREDQNAAIDRLQLQRATANGSGVQTLDSLRAFVAAGFLRVARFDHHAQHGLGAARADQHAAGAIQLALQRFALRRELRVALLFAERRRNRRSSPPPPR